MNLHQLHEMPDDGNRYELIDGELFVTPTPDVRHQQMVLQLCLRLRPSFPPHVIALTAPLAVELNVDTEVRPDVLAAPFANFAETNLPVAPALAVEVSSPVRRCGT